ncbi:unnamed protein product [Schistosoma margrebowiei]|uniref:Uncharacterized protein n=1 Tax=Schistosoma margrebowiei TaxID=48269 RepID=A0A3P8AW77_9TREM|nr:unnamed protein product [Schistosoma margrebowiei]
MDVDLLGQEIIQDYQIKEFDLTNLHPDTKYLICFRVTRKRFVSSSISSSPSSLSSSPSLYIQSNGTIATLTPTFKSSIHHQNKTNNVNNISDNLKYQQKINNPIISYKNISFLNRSYRQQSSLINSKFNNEYVAEMKCQITFTRFLHWTAILCSLIGIVIALLLSIMIFSILKSRAYKLKQSERKMYFNQKGELLLIGHKKLGKMKDKNIKLNIPSEVKEDNEMNISKQQLEDWENTLKNIETDNTIIIEKDNMLNSITKPLTYSNKTEITNDINCKNNNSIQLTSLDSHNDELNNNDFIKPISISLTESSLIHFRHHIPEYTQMDNNNNRLQSNNPSSYFEIKSPLLKEFEQKSCTSMHPVDNETENNINTIDDNPKINDTRMIEIVTNKLNTNEVTVQLPISPNNSPTNTIGKNSTVSIPDNDALLIDISTSDNDGKHFISNDKNWFITSSGSTSNVLVDKNEQKSIFCTQLIETL